MHFDFFLMAVGYTVCNRKNVSPRSQIESPKIADFVNCFGTCFFDSHQIAHGEQQGIPWMQREKENHRLKEKDENQSFLDWILATCDRLLFGTDKTAADSEPELGIWTPPKSEKDDGKD